MTIPRALLEKYFGQDPRMVLAMEDQSKAVEAATNNIPATVAMNDATVLTLSPNQAFDNEYVTIPGYGIAFDIEAGTLTIKIDLAKVMTTQAPAIDLSTIVSAANDTAAATAGVQKGQLYLNGSVVQARVT